MIVTWKILTVNADQKTDRFIKANLIARGFSVISIQEEEDAIRTLDHTSPDLIIIDVMIPEMDGIEFYRRLRQLSKIPAILIINHNMVNNIVDLMEIHADNYVTKPFGIEELLARVRAVLRRKGGGISPEKAIFVNDNLQINFAERWVTINGDEVDLSPTEYDLHREMAQNWLAWSKIPKNHQIQFTLKLLRFRESA